MEQLAKNMQSAMDKKGVSVKWIVANTTLSEKTVNRLHKGTAKNPGSETLLEVADALDVTTDFLLKGTNIVLGTQDLATLTEQNEQLTAKVAEFSDIIAALNDTIAELTDKNVILSEQACHYKTENNILQIKLELKDKLLEVHEHYMKKQNS